MNGFTLLKRGECPVCAGIRKDCRRSNESGMLFCRESAANPSGFIFRGLDRWGFGLWQPTEDAEAFSQKSKEQWQQEQEQRRIENERRRQQQIASQLPAGDRDRFYSKILDLLSLTRDDLHRLKERGFTDQQIRDNGFRSVGAWERVNGSFPSNLPGLLGSGSLNSQPGIIFPVRDVDNRIVALSIRLIDGTNGRYRWLTSTTKKNPSGASPHLNGELPVSVFEPGENRGDAVWLTEGLGIKPSLTRYRLGVPVVGASSGLFSASGNSCQTTLEKLSLKYQTKRLVIAVDAGDIQNSHVCQRWAGEFEFLKSLGYNLQIAWWGQYNKDDDDIDELQDLSNISFIGVEEFLAWANLKEENGKKSTKAPFILNPSKSNKNSSRAGKPQSGKDNQGSFTVAQSKISIPLNQPSPDSLEIPKSKDGDFSNSNTNLANSAGQLSSAKRLENKTGKRLSEPLSCRGIDILNPPLIAFASLPIQPLKDGISKVLPIPPSVESCLTTEEKAPREERRWFERVLKRVKKVFSKNVSKSKLPRLGFKALPHEDKPELEEKIRQCQRKLRSLSYEVDIALSQRYLPNELVNQLPKSGLIGIKAPKGCGKSVLLKKIIAIAKKQGIPVLSITPRIALGREQAVKWEITWIDDYGIMRTRAEDTTKQIQEVVAKQEKAKEKLSELEKINFHQLSLLGNTEIEDLERKKADLSLEIEKYEQEIENINASTIKTLALCWDSLWRTKDRSLLGGLIVIDEAELGFKHFISGSTCRRSRPQLLAVFREKLNECLMGGGRVILSDADLTDLPIKYVQGILPIPIKPFIVSNEFVSPETRWLVDFRTGSRGDSLDELLSMIEFGSYIAVTTDSQAEAAALEKLIIEKFPDDFCSFIDSNGEITQDAQARKKALIVRIDRTTTEVDAGKNFIQKPNEQILFWRPRVLIFTPSMGVGVSIDETTQRWDEEWQEEVPYFDSVFGLFFGVIEPSQCRQQLARVRANVPRIVYCKESNRALEGCPSFFPSEVKRHTFKYNQHSLTILDIAKSVSSYDADDEEIRENMIRVLNECWDSQSKTWKEPAIDLDASFKARENYGLSCLANLLREELEDEGHTVVALKGQKTDLIAWMRGIKDEMKAEEAKGISEAPLMPDVEEAKKVLNKLGATKEEQRSAQKTLLQEELPGKELSPEFIKKAVVDDRRRWLNHQKLFWYYSNFDAIKQIDTDNWLANLKKFASGTPFIRDIRSVSPKVDVLRKCGLFEFINLEDPDKIYQGDTPEAEAFLKKCLKVKEELEVTLNVRVSQKSYPISLASRLLERVELGLRKVSRSKKDKRYQLDVQLLNDPDRLATLKALDLRWELSQKVEQEEQTQKTPQTYVQQAVKVGGEVANYIYIDPSSPPNIEEVSQGVGEPSGEFVPTVEEIAQALPWCDRVETLGECVEDYGPELVELAIALQDSQPRRQQLSEWLELLAHSESTAGEELAQVSPIQDESRIKSYAQMLSDTFERGIEAFKRLLGQWEVCDRWKAVEQFELISPNKMTELIQLAPGWWEWCGV